MSDIQNFSLTGAEARDIPELARMNYELIRDEGSANPMGIPEL